MSDKKFPASVPYESSLYQRLKDPEYAIGYLNAIIADSESDEELRATLLVGLRHVVKANSFSQVAKVANKGRENLYKSLSQSGNPTIGTLLDILHSIGLDIRFALRHQVANS